MSHQTLFTKFDKMKVGDTFYLPINGYKSHQTATGTLGKAASEYRQKKNPHFWIKTKSDGMNILVEKVKNGRNHKEKKVPFKANEMVDRVMKETNNIVYALDIDKPFSKDEIIKMYYQTGSTLHRKNENFPHDSADYINGICEKINTTGIDITKMMNP